jgi:hypothetical protein
LWPPFRARKEAAKILGSIIKTLIDNVERRGTMEEAIELQAPATALVRFPGGEDIGCPGRGIRCDFCIVIWREK